MYKFTTLFLTLFLSISSNINLSSMTNDNVQSDSKIETTDKEAEWKFIQEKLAGNKKLNEYKNLAWKAFNGLFGGFASAIISKIASEKYIVRKSRFDNIPFLVFLAAVTGITISSAADIIKNYCANIITTQSQLQILLESDISNFPKELHKDILELKTKSATEKIEILKTVNEKIAKHFAEDLSKPISNLKPNFVQFCCGFISFFYTMSKLNS